MPLSALAWGPGHPSLVIADGAELLAYDAEGHAQQVATLATPVPTRAAVVAGDRLEVLTASGLAAYPLP